MVIKMIYDETISRASPSTNKFPVAVTGTIWYYLVNNHGNVYMNKIRNVQRTNWFYQVKIGPRFDIGHFEAKLNGNFWILSENVFYPHLQLGERSFGRIRVNNALSADKRLRKSVLEYIKVISLETGLPFMKEPQLIEKRLKAE